MKLVKSLLLGSAAGIVAVGSAVAADLPVRKAAPVDYVQVCSQFGTGYFFIPGTDTCLKIGGRVRYNMVYGEQKRTVDQTVGSGAITSTMGRTGNLLDQNIGGHIDFSAMTATEFGTLEAFVRLNGASLGTTYVDIAGLRVGQFASLMAFGDSPAYQNAFGLGTGD